MGLLLVSATIIAMFEETVRKNMELYGQAMKMFAPLSNMYTPGAAAAAGENTEPAKSGSGGESEIDDLKAQLATLQNQLEKLQRKDDA